MSTNQAVEPVSTVPELERRFVVPFSTQLAICAVITCGCVAQILPAFCFWLCLAYAISLAWYRHVERNRRIDNPEPIEYRLHAPAIWAQIDQALKTARANWKNVSLTVDYSNPEPPPGQPIQIQATISIYHPHLRERREMLAPENQDLKSRVVLRAAILATTGVTNKLHMIWHVEPICGREMENKVIEKLTKEITDLIGLHSLPVSARLETPADSAGDTRSETTDRPLFSSIWWQVHKVGVNLSLVTLSVLMLCWPAAGAVLSHAPAQGDMQPPIERSEPTTHLTFPERSPEQSGYLPPPSKNEFVSPLDRPPTDWPASSSSQIGDHLAAAPRQLPSFLANPIAEALSSLILILIVLVGFGLISAKQAGGMANSFVRFIVSAIRILIGLLATIIPILLAGIGGLIDEVFARMSKRNTTPPPFPQSSPGAQPAQSHTQQQPRTGYDFPPEVDIVE